MSRRRMAVNDATEEPSRPQVSIAASQMPASTSRKRLFRHIVLAVSVCGAAAMLVIAGQPDPMDDVSETLRNADRLIGQRVTVVGRVKDVISAKSMTISDDTRTILVLGIPVPPALDDDLDGEVTDERAEVSGVLRTLTLEEVERHVGELDDQRYQQFVGQPVIVAHSFRPL